MKVYLVRALSADRASGIDGEFRASSEEDAVAKAREQWSVPEGSEEFPLVEVHLLP